MEKGKAMLTMEEGQRDGHASSMGPQEEKVHLNTNTNPDPAPDPDEIVLAELREVLSEPEQLQEGVLSEILKENAGCHYLCDHGLGGRTDKAAFKRCIPIADYCHIEPYIERIAAGDRSPLLCTYDIVSFGLSSGTSAGKVKMIPITTRISSMQRMGKYAIALMNRSYPACNEGKILNLTVAGKQFETKSGHKVGSASTNAFRDEKRRKSFDTSRWTSPFEVVLCDDTRQGLYCHLLCGLVQSSEVKRIDATFAFLVVEAFRNLEQCWQEICEDIRTGSLNKKVVDENTREAVCALLQPNPDLADTIERECGKASWAGIARRLWPNLVCLHCIATGPTFRPYIAQLNFYSADLPIVMVGYAATEGSAMALNLNYSTSPYDVTYTFIPFSVYFEFIPVHKRQEFEGDVASYLPEATSTEEDGNITTLELHELQLGQYYEVIITTYQGLYRYRLGDIFKVAGFDQRCPKMEYVGRRNVLLGLTTDKTDEQELEIVMGKARVVLQSNGKDLSEFTTYVDHSTNPGHYVFVWEMREKPGLGAKGKEKEDEIADQKAVFSVKEEEVGQKCCSLMDRWLNRPYRHGRKVGTIGPLELKVVSHGTFQELMQVAMNQGTSSSQYKPPRCIVSPALLQVVNRHTKHVFYSTNNTWDDDDDISQAINFSS